MTGPASDGWSQFDTEVATQPDVPCQRVVLDDSPLYQMYTSGTTGTPKGAVLTHGAVMANVMQLQTAIGLYRTHAVVVMPLFHGAAAVTAFLNVLNGSTTRVVRDFEPPKLTRDPPRRADRNDRTSPRR